jgi:hypothetical protein
VVREGSSLPLREPSVFNVRRDAPTILMDLSQCQRADTSLSFHWLNVKGTRLACANSFALAFCYYVFWWDSS